MNTITGLLSPQYHVLFNDFFKKSFIRIGILLLIQLGKSSKVLFFTMQTRSNLAHTNLHWSYQAEVGSNNLWQSTQWWPYKLHVSCSNSLFEATDGSNEFDISAASVNDLNDSADHEHQGALQACHHPLSVQIIHDEADKNMGSSFGISLEVGSGLCPAECKVPQKPQPGNALHCQVWSTNLPWQWF